MSAEGNNSSTASSSWGYINRPFPYALQKNYISIMSLLKE